jgi:hypothetical protein
MSTGTDTDFELACPSPTGSPFADVASLVGMEVVADTGADMVADIVADPVGRIVSEVPAEVTAELGPVSL